MKRRSPPKAEHPTPAELGQMMANIYESGYLDRNQAYKMSFIKGVVSGLGGFIGATIVVGFILWFLSFFRNVPLLNRFSSNVQRTLQTPRR